MGFIDDTYLLETDTALDLYDAIADEPILDPHSHVDLEEVVENDGWSDIWEVQGATDHYVWELMRKRGVDEEKITGDASNKEKWLALAEVFPEFVGNPTYEWVHLDLKRRFDIEKRIGPETAEEIWTETKELLDGPEYTPQALLKEMNVEVMCSTDDPTDDLADHERAAEELDGIDVKPTWRPDRALKVDADGWLDFVVELQEARGIDTSDLEGFLAAMADSHDYFEDHGCVASDLGIEQPISNPVSEDRAALIYERAYSGATLDPEEVRDFEAFVLEKIGEWNRETDWVTQLHIGAVRDYRWSLYDELGPDTGGDISTQDIELVDSLEYFFNTFDEELEIVLYTVDPTHYPTTASIARAFPNVSLGAAWWFNDSPFGMEQQLNYVGTVDLLSNYAGMVSDSRKLVSYGSRFEMFRRSLANAVGDMVERGQIPEPEAHDLVEHMAYDRPKELFGF
ncbi:glucuronate isomerase [Halorhabdus amylolytica]|uniref:glucuronate isomerase n=1 Tax=Halorhabdus amylolytica TaxID=2559573 RepID=UPI0010AA5577|nr:glucuronate isomerase [Halorhabdus amylolytica]